MSAAMMIEHVNEPACEGVPSMPSDVTALVDELRREIRALKSRASKLDTEEQGADNEQSSDLEARASVILQNLIALGEEQKRRWLSAVDEARRDCECLEEELSAQAAKLSALEEAERSARAKREMTLISQADRVNVGVAISDSSEDNFYEGLVANEGLGVFVAGTDVLPLNTSVDLVVSFLDEKLEVSGIVRWTRDWSEENASICAGMGIEFIGIDSKTLTRANNYMQVREPWVFSEASH